MDDFTDACARWGLTPDDVDDAAARACHGLLTDPRLRRDRAILLLRRTVRDRMPAVRFSDADALSLLRQCSQREAVTP